ncbi:MAG: hypothetical protein E7571_05190 [Ruminococcaceae bacterium]|nr:hypothetical protein [Oscillospiraceae bacterium]
MKKVTSFLLAVIILLVPSTAFAEKDEQSPIILMNTLSIYIPDGKELAEAGDNVEIYVSATDNVAVESMLIQVDAPSGSSLVLKMMPVENTDYFAAVIPIDESSDAGYWNISKMKATDPSGHYMFITNLTEYKFGVKGSILENDISFNSGEYTYTPSGVKPDVAVTHSGITLTKGADYEVEYINNKSVGTAAAVIRGIGCFGGEYKKEFTVIPQTKFKVELSNQIYTYNGKEKRPAVTVYDGKYVVGSSDYAVTYAKGRTNVGKYAVKITMKNNYSGSKTAYIVIKPQGTSLTSLAANKKGFTAKWKKQAVQTDGYQLQYSVKSNFAGAKSVIIKKPAQVTKTLGKLKKNKKFYVRIRTYKTVNGRTIYSKWSAAKSVKTN